MVENASPAPGETEPCRNAPGRAREAQENDVSVLTAAKSVFIEQGWSAPMSAIAERAGVGIGSLYRRYPSKEALGQALWVAAMRQLSDLIEDAIAELPPDRALEAVFNRYLESPFGPLVSVIGGRRMINTPEVTAAVERMHEALTRLAEISHECGVLPGNYGATDLIVLLAHMRTALPGKPETMAPFDKRLVEPLLIGLRTMAADPTNGNDQSSALQWDEWARVWNGDALD